MITETVKKIIVAAAVIIIIPAALFAQQQQPDPRQMQMQQEMAEVSDKELSNFVSAFDSVNSLQQEMNVKMVEAVEEAGMSVESFNTVFNEIQTSQSQDEMTATDEDIEKYNQAIPKVQKVQIGYQKKTEDAIENEGLTTERYDQIYAVLQQDEETLKRFQKIISE